MSRDEAPTASFLVERQPWVKVAACQGVPTEVFFEAVHTDEALGYCEGCAQREPCLAQAMIEEGSAPYGRFGVRGGTTAHERQRLHRSRKRVTS